MLFCQLLILGVWSGSLYALMAIGLILSRRVSGFVNFAYGALALTSAYLTYACMTWSHITAIPAVTIAVVATCVLAVVFDIMVFRPLHRRAATPFVFMVTSLGLFIVVENLVALIFGDQTMSLPDIKRNPIRLASYTLTSTQLAAVMAMAAFTALLAIVLKTKTGEGVRAVAADAQLAEICGVRTRESTTMATVMAAVPAAVAGILWACDNDLNITLGFRLLLFGLTASVIGGSRWGTSALLGGLMVGIVQYASIWRIGTEWQDSIVFGLLVVFLIFKPHGLLGTVLPRRTS
jgi:branched-chain amino acid transport system permease protein